MTTVGKGQVTIQDNKENKEKQEKKQKPIDMVATFHRVFGHPVHAEWNAESYRSTWKLRAKLIREEFNELSEALKKHDKVEMVDALMDLLYVTYGAALCFGLSSSLTEPSCDLLPAEPQESEEVRYGIWTSAYVRLSTVVQAALEEIESEMEDDEELAFRLQNVVDQIHVMMSLMNVDCERAFREVHESNMTKVCHTEEEAQQTLAYYRVTSPSKSSCSTAQKEKETYKPVYRYDSENKYWIVSDQLSGKILKNVHYTAVNLSWVLP